MKIYIPTYRRTHRQVTFSRLPEDWKRRSVFVCDERDATILSRLPHATILLHPPEIDTIAKKRAWIIANATEEKLVMMDDDLRFDHRVYLDPDGDLTKLSLPKASADTVGKWLSATEQKLDTHVHVGWSARQMNQRKSPGWEYNCRMMYVLAYRPAALREHCELGRIEHREDFDYTLQLLRKGFPNAVCTEIMAGQDKYNAPGGASLQRTMEASNADAVKLAELHPGLVKVVDKDYNTSIPRKEVIIQWKKALNADVV